MRGTSKPPASPHKGKILHGLHTFLSLPLHLPLTLLPLPQQVTLLRLDRYLPTQLSLPFERLHLEGAFEADEWVLAVARILFLKLALGVLISEAMDDVVEGLVLAEEFLALTAALDGISGVDEDGHLLKKLIFPN